MIELNTTELNLCLAFLRPFERQPGYDAAESVLFERVGRKAVCAVRGKFASGTYEISTQAVFDPFAINTGRLQQLSKLLGDDQTIVLTPGKTSHEVRFTRGVLRLSAYTVEEPFRPERPAIEPLRVSAGKLAAMVAGVAHCAGNDSHLGAKYELNSLLIEFRDDELSVVATDGRRLAVRRCTIDAPPPVDESDREARDEVVRHIRLVLPMKAVSLLHAVLVPGTDAFIWPGQNQAFVSSGPRRAILPLCEGRFPDFRKLLEHAGDPAGKVTLDREEFLSVLRLCSGFAESDSRAVDLLMKDGTMSVEFNGSESELPYKSRGNPPDNVLFDNRFLKEAFQAIDEEKVTISLDALGVKQAVFRGGDHTEIIMPMSRDETEKKVG